MTTPTAFAAADNTFVAYVDPDGVIHQFVVVGWLHHAGRHALPLTASGLPKDAPAEIAVLHPNGVVTDVLGMKSFASVGDWSAAEAARLKGKPRRQAPPLLQGKAISDFSDGPETTREIDREAIDRAVREVRADPTEGLGIGPTASWSRDDTGEPPKPPAEIDLAALAHDPDRPGAKPVQEPAKPAAAPKRQTAAQKAQAALPEDLGDLI